MFIITADNGLPDIYVNITTRVWLTALTGMPVGLMRLMVNQKNVRQPGKVSMIFFDSMSQLYYTEDAKIQ